MDSLLLKLVLTPVLIVVAALVGRRWGPALSGWLIGLPLTSGPVTLVLALDHGSTFAATAAQATLAGTLAECAFCLTYGWVSRRLGWPLTLAASTVAFALAIAGLRRFVVPAVPLFAAVVLGLLVSLLLMPTTRPRELCGATATPPWDLPARALVATVFVVALTALAPALGPRLTGLVAPFPVYASILASFAHQQQGSAGAVFVVRGLLVGLFGFATFFLALALSLPLLALAPSFAVATGAALAVQGSSLLLLRTQRTGIVGSEPRP